VKETELCANFAEAARDDGWIVYPECCSWDLVLVWSGEVPDRIRKRGRRLKFQIDALERLEEGFQMAIEAKVSSKYSALCQCIKRLKLTAVNIDARSEEYGSEKYIRKSGPDQAAILADSIPGPLATLARHMRLGTYDLGDLEERRDYFQDEGFRRPITPRGRQLHFPEPLWTPPVDGVGTAGESSPSALTRWRVGALKVCWLLNHRGWVTSLDFKNIGIGINRWRQAEWIVPTGEKVRQENPSNSRKYDYKQYEWGRRVESRPDVGWEDTIDAIVSADAEGIPDELLEAS
jgi:hypothetical protein